MSNATWWPIWVKHVKEIYISMEMQKHLGLEKKAQGQSRELGTGSGGVAWHRHGYPATGGSVGGGQEGCSQVTLR